MYLLVRVNSKLSSSFTYFSILLHFPIYKSSAQNKCHYLHILIFTKIFPAAVEGPKKSLPINDSISRPPINSIKDNKSNWSRVGKMDLLNNGREDRHNDAENVEEKMARGDSGGRRESNGTDEEALEYMVAIPETDGKFSWRKLWAL